MFEQQIATSRAAKALGHADDVFITLAFTVPTRFIDAFPASSEIGARFADALAELLGVSADTIFGFQVRTCSDI